MAISALGSSNSGNMTQEEEAGNNATLNNRINVQSEATTEVEPSSNGVNSEMDSADGDYADASALGSNNFRELRNGGGLHDNGGRSHANLLASTPDSGNASSILQNTAGELNLRSTLGVGPQTRATSEGTLFRLLHRTFEKLIHCKCLTTF